MYPVKLNKTQLAELLTDIASEVLEGGSWNGSLEYDGLAESCGPDEFEVTAVYRLGSGGGQGSVRLVGQMERGE
jgi:hypothetical protein